MTRLPVVRPREVIRALERAGFVLDRVKGSHYIMWSERTRRTVSVPHHNRDMKRRLLNKIINESGLTREEFLKLL